MIRSVCELAKSGSVKNQKTSHIVQCQSCRLRVGTNKTIHILEDNMKILKILCNFFPLLRGRVIKMKYGNEGYVFYS